MSTIVRNQSRRSGPDGPASYCQKWCLTIDQAAVGTCQQSDKHPERSGRHHRFQARGRMRSVE